MFRFIPCVFLLLALAACASNTDLDVLSRDVDNLKRDTFESRKEIAGLKESTAKVVSEESFTALRDSQGELNARVSEIASGMQELRGRFEEGRYYQEKILKESASEKDLLKAQIAGIESQVKAMKDRLALLEEGEKNRLRAEPEKGPQSGQPGSGETQAETADDKSADKDRQAPGDGTGLYDTAYNFFKERKFRESREKFEAFLKDSPRHKLAGNAQFWIAETYYSEKDFESAILAYENLLKKYPGSEKSSSALLKQGLAFAEIGDSKTARVILEKLIQKYPNSKESALAKKRLAELGKKPGRKK